MTPSTRGITVAAAGLAACAIGLSGAAGAASSKSPAPSTFKGKTNNGLPVTFKITSGKVHNFSATVHALCVSVLSPGTSHLDPVLHLITPPPIKLASGGKFSADYKIKTNSTHAKVDGKVSGKKASGHYTLAYNKTDGATSFGVLIIYACQEKGTWTATLH